ncbi:Vomeronasal type-1 receptor 3 [Tupaia chinensis]|uniref:Vomeronasal type-1 receptor n=2 Tax=Tupaia chinensis TaxID=246437 RepID=L8YBK6_TUPCH|nr:Vomeronasal type-1 receptor 3 [Tupaia chinensis]
MAAFVSKYYLSDIECKLVFYVHRVGRGVSMGSTCLLSVFQAITISPRDSMWAELKLQAPKHTGNFSILCWILNILVNIQILLYMSGKCNCKNSTKITDYGYCSGTVSSSTVQPVHYLLLSSYDVLCLGLMIWASGSMVFILLRHKQRVQHIHGTSPSPS